MFNNTNLYFIDGVRFQIAEDIGACSGQSCGDLSAVQVDVIGCYLTIGLSWVSPGDTDSGVIDHE